MYKIPSLKVLAASSLLVFTMSGCEKGAESNATVTAEQALLPSAKQQDIDLIAQTLQVKYQVISNKPTKECDQDKEHGLCYQAKLSFTANEAISAGDWQVFFSQVVPIQSFESKWFEVKHINGDLHRVTLKPEFNGFAKGETKTLTFRALFWSLSETDAVPNYIVTANDLTPRVIESTVPSIDPETGLEVLNHTVSFTDNDQQFKRTDGDETTWVTPEVLFNRHQQQGLVADVDVKRQLIPTPGFAEFDADKSLDLSSGINLNMQNVAAEQVESALERLASLGIKQNEQGVPLSLAIETDEQKKIGSYKLSIKDQGIRISGVDANGVFNGLMSLAGLITLGDSSVAQGEIIDQPHFEFRGLLVDVARNFRSKAFILSLLDQMAAYKMNKLHLHLGDDEGWRLEIPSLPELTEVGSKRCFDPSETECLMPQLGAGLDPNSEVNGYYSVADYKEILAAASKRYIQVIPSLDMPGHSRAAVKSMEARYQKYMALEQEEKALEFRLHDPQDTTVYSSVQYYGDNTINVCLESSYAFVEQVMKDVQQIHQSAGQPLTRYHIGADETAGAWVDSPECKDFLAKHSAQVSSAKELGAYFVERIANMLADMGIEAAAWNDGLEHTNPDNMPAVIQANAWSPLMWDGHQQAHQLANYNWQVVVSSPDVTYFDFPYEADPKEHGYYWAARSSNTQKMFEFMPDNLPAHAEFWTDREKKPYVADDTVRKDESGKLLSAPLAQGQNFLGVQGQLWSEITRTRATAEYKLFPRLLALAERGWHKANWAVPYNHDGFKYSHDTNTFTQAMREQRDLAWANFSATLGQKELAKLELANIQYRLPTVGAVILDGKLHANVAFPGIAIEYQLNGGEWQSYQEPVTLNPETDVTVYVRTKSYDGKRSGRKTLVSQ